MTVCRVFLGRFYMQNVHVYQRNSWIPCPTFKDSRLLTVIREIPASRPTTTTVRSEALVNGPKRRLVRDGRPYSRPGRAIVSSHRINILPKKRHIKNSLIVHVFLHAEEGGGYSLQGCHGHAIKNSSTCRRTGTACHRACMRRRGAIVGGS